MATSVSRSLVLRSSIWLVSLLLWGGAAAPGWAAGEGDRLFAAGDYAAALAAYAQEVAANPQAADRPTTLLQMARCHLRLHRPWLAEVRLRRLLDEDLETDAAATAATLLDQLLVEQRRWEEALQIADTLLGHQPVRARPRLLAMRTHALIALDRHEEAARAFATLYRTLPADQRPAVEEVAQRWLAARPDSFLRSVIGAFDASFPADYALLMLIERLRDGDPNLARRLTNQFLATFPGHPRAAALRPPPPPPVAAPVVAAAPVAVVPPPAVVRSYDAGRIDLLAPTTGPLAAIGNALFQGATLAVEAYNAQRQPPPGSPPVTLTLHDTGDEAVQAEATLRNLLGRDPLPVAVIGPATSPACRRLAPLAAAVGLPLITPSAAAPDLPLDYPYLFRVGMSDEAQVARLVDHAVRARGARRLACLYPNNAYGNHFRDLFVEQARCLGLGLVAQANYPPGAVDFGGPIRSLLAQEEAANARLVAERPFVAAPPDPVAPLPWPAESAGLPAPPPRPNRPRQISGIDAVFLPGPAATVGLAMAQLSYYGVEEAVWLATEEAAAPELIERGERFARAAVIATGFSPTASQGAAAFATTYRSRYGHDPDRLAFQAYQAVQVVVAGLAQGVRSGPDLAAFLGHSLTVDGLTGPLSVEPGGEIATPPVLLTVRIRRLVALPDDLSEITTWTPPTGSETAGGARATDEATPPTPATNPEGMAPGRFQEDRSEIPIP